MSDTKEDLEHLDTNSGDSSQIGRRPSDIIDNAEPTEAELLANYVPGTDEEKKLVRKIDLYLLPMLWVMYILNYVDRTNIVSHPLSFDLSHLTSNREMQE
jgi:hypothetical protein